MRNRGRLSKGPAGLKYLAPIALVLVLAVAAFSVGCGDEETPATTAAPETTAPAASSSTTAAPAESSTTTAPAETTTTEAAKQELILASTTSTQDSGLFDVLIPAFTLGRTQEVMAVIDRYQRKGVIPAESEVYVDSPTAHKITAVYRELREELSEEAREQYPDEPLRFPPLREVRSRTSMKVHDRRHSPAIFVSSSGDLGHANSPRHLMRMFARRENLLCVIGWQAPGSPGARLLAGESPVLIRHREGSTDVEDWIAPALSVTSSSAFSGHADAAGLLRWIAGVRGVRKVFLVHGEERSANSLAGSIRRTLGLEVDVPARGAVRTLAPVGGS